jgi:hypothetical protein
VSEIDTETLMECHKPNSKPYGLSYGMWTVEWWRWAMSIPKSKNPLIDNSGKYADINQPDKVWFLAGRFGSEDQGFPHRKCTIPAGKSILFPVINCEANSVEYPELKTEQDLLDHVSKDLNSIVRKECFANGHRILPQRVRSDPIIFLLSVNEELDGLDRGCHDIPSTADGYWVFLRPPAPGTYNIEFVGTCENGRLSSGASYEIRIA